MASEKRYGDMTAAQIADGGSFLDYEDAMELARDLIAAQARIAELVSWRNTLFMELVELAEGLCGPLPPGQLNNELHAAIARSHAEWRQRCDAAESTIARVNDAVARIESPAVGESSCACIDFAG